METPASSQTRAKAPGACLVLLAALLLPLPAALGAEVLVLRNGLAIEGYILRQSTYSIFVRLRSGKTQTIAKSKLKKIQYVPLTPEQKGQQQAIKRRRYLAWRARRARIQKAKIAAVERERRLRALEKAALQQKKKEAVARARRAAALRDLVKNKKMAKPEDEAISAWDFSWRSLVLPGWGHFKLDRPLIGAAYMGGAAVLLARIYDTRRTAVAAIKENRRQVRENFLLSMAPSLADLSVRTAFAYNANGKAALVYERKVERYHGALLSMGLLYGLQLLHIAYNAIAWEKGLLIVRNDAQWTEGVTTDLALVPDVAPDRASSGRSSTKVGRRLKLGLRWHF